MKPVEAVMGNDEPLRWRRIGLMVMIALAAGSVLVVLLEQRQRTFPGSFDARKILIATNRPARVQDIAVRAGQSVVPGSLICQLTDTLLEDRLSSKQREILQYEAEIGRLKASAEVELTHRRRELQSEIFETQLKIAALSQQRLNKQVEQIAWKERLSTLESNVVPIAGEAGKPMIRPLAPYSQRSNDQQLQAMLREDAAATTIEALSTQIALCDERLTKLGAMEKELDAKIGASSGVDVAETRLNGAKQELAVLESQMKELTITSPTYGTVADIKLQPGQTAQSGMTLVELLDDQRPHVIAQIPSSEAVKFHEGDRVTLVFPANERRTGMITSLATQATSVSGMSEACLPVKIEPAGKLWPKLAIGSDVRLMTR